MGCADGVAVGISVDDGSELGTDVGSSLGISVGCIFGMIPLLFTEPTSATVMHAQEDKIEEQEAMILRFQAQMQKMQEKLVASVRAPTDTCARQAPSVGCAHY